MPISFRRSVFAGSGLLVSALLLCVSLTAPQAIGQESTSSIPAPLLKQLNRFDLAISAAGSLSTSTSGIEQRDASATTIVNSKVTPDPTMLTIKPSNTVGELLTLRYTVKPLVGFEFNVSNFRFTQDYTFNPLPSGQYFLIGGAQAAVREMTLGWVFHPRTVFGLQPYVGAGGGTIRFKPTPYGGQGLPEQYRAAYYYNLGLEDTFPNSHFGVRLGFRQLIYLDPDFQQNYLTITRRVRTSQPTFGFYLRF
jgi:hypothetical protein